MSDPLGKVAHGEGPASGEGMFSVQFQHDNVDAVRDWKRRTGPMQAGPMELDPARPLWIVNGSATDIDQFGVVGLATPIAGPHDYEPSWRNEKVFNSASPTPTGPFAITLEPIGSVSGTSNPRVGKAITYGEVQCQLQRTSTSHLYAAPDAGNYVNLISQAGLGPATIMWTDDLPVASIGANIIPGSGPPGGGTGSNGDWYSDNTNLLYYGPKTAGAWGTGQPFGTGLVWALVKLCGLAPAITSINGDTTAAQDIGIGSAGIDVNLKTTAAAYSAGTTYSAGWVVTSAGSTYRFINATPSAGHAPPNATYWADITGHGLTNINLPDAAANGWDSAGASVRGAVSTTHQMFHGKKGNDDAYYADHFVTGVGIFAAKTASAGSTPWDSDGFDALTVNNGAGLYLPAATGGFPGFVAHLFAMGTVGNRDAHFEIDGQNGFSARFRYYAATYPGADGGGLGTVYSPTFMYQTGYDAGGFITFGTGTTGTVNGLSLVGGHVIGGSITGFVTSVSGSGGSTGLTLTGGPITGSGTLTLGGTLTVANGGTGATSFTAGQILVGNGTSAMSPAASTKVTSGELSLKGATGKWFKFTAPAAY